jgi:hypothetical protein
MSGPREASQLLNKSKGKSQKSKIDFSSFTGAFFNKEY